MPKLPKDIYPDSGCRLPMLRREDMNDHGRKVHDKVVGPGSRTIVGLRGPRGIDLYSPRLAELHFELSQYVRFETGLPAHVRELAILVAAREMNSQFEWSAHESVALTEGLSPEIIDIVKNRLGVAKLPETEAVIIQFGREMFQRRKVTSRTFKRALKIFDPKQLVNLVALMGHYASTALKLRAFDMQLASDKEPLLPLP